MFLQFLDRQSQVRKIRKVYFKITNDDTFCIVIYSVFVSSVIYRLFFRIVLYLFCNFRTDHMSHYGNVIYI